MRTRRQGRFQDDRTRVEIVADIVLLWARVAFGIVLYFFM